MKETIVVFGDSSSGSNVDESLRRSLQRGIEAYGCVKLTDPEINRSTPYRRSRGLTV